MQATLVRKQLTCTSQRTKSPALKALLGIVAVYRLAPAEAALSGRHIGKRGSAMPLGLSPFREGVYVTVSVTICRNYG